MDFDYNGTGVYSKSWWMDLITFWIGSVLYRY